MLRCGRVVALPTFLGKRKRGGAKAQRSPDFKPRVRARRRKDGGRWRTWSGCFLVLATGAALLCGYWKLRGRVFDLRVGRAYQVSLKVLEQTQRPLQEQQRYATAIARNTVEKGLNPAVVSAIVVVESSGNPLTVSPSGDLGLMQVNVRIHARHFDFQKKNLLNPEENIDVGTSILKTMVERHGDEKAVQAYNGLLPEKREYNIRVQTALARAGFSVQNQPVSLDSGLWAQISDWIAAARMSDGS